MNRSFYLLSALFPFIGIIALFMNDVIYWGIALLVTYVLVYRPWLDWLRVNKEGSSKKYQFWKFFIPGYRLKHFRELYVNA